MNPKCLHDIGDGWCNRFCCWCNAYCSSPTKCKFFVKKEVPLPPGQRLLFPDTTSLS